MTQDDIRPLRGCKVDDCGQPHKSSGYCAKHWSRWYRHGDPHANYAPPPRPKCSQPGCDRLHQAKGWCRKHYQRFTYRSRKRVRQIVGGIEGNTVCQYRGKCAGEPIGGGRFCLRHFWSEIVNVSSRRRGAA